MTLVGAQTRSAAAALGVCALLAAGAARGDGEHRAAFTPFAGYRAGGRLEQRDAGRDADFDADASIGLAFDWTLDDGRLVEGVYSRQATRVDAQGGAFDVTMHYLHGGGALVWVLPKLRPYLAGTIGVTVADPSPSELDTETRLSLALGGGLWVALGTRVSLRLDGRVYATFFDSNARVFCSGGCEAFFAGRTFVQGELSAGFTIAF